MSKATDKIKKIRKRAAQQREALGITPELERILAVELRRPPDDLQREVDSIKETIRLRRKKGAPPLWPIQAWALRELRKFGRLVAPVGVGGGKTWIAALAPTVLKAKRAIVLTKPSLVASTEAEIERLRPWYPVLKPSKLKVVSYNVVSSPRTASVLRDFNPDVVIADEAHCLRDLDSARTRRTLSFVLERRENGGRCVFVPMSGTMTERSVYDYVHLYALALGDACPLPTDSTIDVWAAVLDARSKPSNNDKACLRRLVKPGMPATVKTLRRAYKRRVKWTPGVVASEEDALMTGLELYKIEEIGIKAVTKAVNELRATWELPDGTELVDEIEFTRHARTLSLGFWNSLKPVKGTPEELVDEWKKARRGWHGARRWALSSWAMTKPGFDSPGLLNERARERRLDRGMLKKFDRWVEIVDAIEWDRRVKWVSRKPLDLVVSSFKKTARDGRGVIWYRSSTALEPALRELGVKCFGAGSRQPRGRDGIVAVQLGVHGEGWNAQHDFSDSFALEVPSSASLWQQFLGRMHRPGQPRDEVRCFIAQWSPELRRALAAAIENARYQEDTKGTRMKLCYATYSPATL